jgi:TolB-like protein
VSEQAVSSESLPDSRANPASTNVTSADESVEKNAETERRKKRKNKVRSAWISFVGRIVAQFVGAAASILLGLMFLQKYQMASAKSGSGGSAKASATIAAPSTPAKQRLSDGHPSIAVLPLESFSPDPRQEALANGMTEALIAGLAQTDSLRVISRTSSMHYKGLHMALPDIGRELGVDLIVEGSVMKAGERVRVIVQLIDANSDEHIWTATYDQYYRGALSLQKDVARTIVRDLNEVAGKGPDGWRSTQRQRGRIVDCGHSASPGCRPKPGDPAVPESVELPAPSSTSTRRP